MSDFLCLGLCVVLLAAAASVLDKAWFRPRRFRMYSRASLIVLDCGAAGRVVSDFCDFDDMQLRTLEIDWEKSKSHLGGAEFIQSVPVIRAEFVQCHPDAFLYRAAR